MSDTPKPLRIWLVCVGEYLPTDPGHERKLRMSMLADTLLARGDEITWWVSTFDHEAKRQRYAATTSLDVSPRYHLKLLHGRPYRRNISLARLINHHQMAEEFRRLAPAETPPDIIVATVPTLELAAAAADHAAKHSIPLLVDIRDQHPDIYLELVPPFARSLARQVLKPLYRQLHAALKGADALTSISPSILRWGLAHAGRSQGPADQVVPIGYPEIGTPGQDLQAAGEFCMAQGVDPSKRIVWYVGTFNRWIDLGTPIEAARHFEKEGRHDIQFVLSGSGDLDARWRAQAEGLANVVFTGWVDVPKIAWLRRVAWLGLAPYNRGFNAFGNKLFEFMAAGLPILFSIEGDAREVLEGHGAGVNFEAGNPRALAQRIQEFLDQPSRRDEYSRNATEAFHRHYRAEAVYRGLADLIHRLAGRNGPVAGR